MKLEIPDDILKSSGLTEEDCLIELSVRLYADRRISLAQALRLSRLDRFAFESQLARRDISCPSRPSGPGAGRATQR